MSGPSFVKDTGHFTCKLVTRHALCTVTNLVSRIALNEYTAVKLPVI